MDMALNRPAVLFALLASLLLALLYALWGDGGGTVPGVEPVDDPAVVITGRSGGLSLQGAGAVRHPQAIPATPTAFAADPLAAGPQGLAKAFESADDLHAFVHRLLPAALAGGAEAAWMVSRVYDYCAAHAADPTGFARDTDQLGRMGFTTSASMAAARERVAHRCRQFSPIDGIDRELVLWYRVEAAEAGSLAAEAALLAMDEPLDDEANYRRDLVDRVQASGDAQAFSALAPAMGLAASGDPAYAGQLAGTPMAELAWQLGACALGLDCAADGALMTSYCVNGGICSRDARQDFPAFVHDSAVPRRGRKALDEMVGSLLGEGVPR